MSYLGEGSDFRQQNKPNNQVRFKNVQYNPNQSMGPGQSMAMAGNTGLATFSENQINKVQDAIRHFNEKPVEMNKALINQSDNVLVNLDQSTDDLFKLINLFLVMVVEEL